VRERETARYVEFVSGRYAALYRTAYLMTGNHHTAEDLVQTVLTRAYVSWRRVSAADSPEGYVRRMLVNEAVSHRRRRWTTELTSPDLLTLVDGNAGPGPEDALTDTAEVWDALRELTPRQRAVVVLRYYEQLTEAEIADVLHIAPGSVKGHARAALAALSTRLPAPLASCTHEEDRQ
jgi:RNA polymerase sigma-70 factor (sigma-E family)